ARSAAPTRCRGVVAGRAAPAAGVVRALLVGGGGLLRGAADGLEVVPARGVVAAGAVVAVAAGIGPVVAGRGAARAPAAGLAPAAAGRAARRAVARSGGGSTRPVSGLGPAPPVVGRQGTSARGAVLRARPRQRSAVCALRPAFLSVSVQLARRQPPGHSILPRPERRYPRRA